MLFDFLSIKVSDPKVTQYVLGHALKHNTGPSLNRKIFTLKTYGRFLKLDQVESADQRTILLKY